MLWAEEFGNGRHIRVKFKRTDDVKRRREEIGGLSKNGRERESCSKKGR